MTTTTGCNFFTLNDLDFLPPKNVAFLQYGSVCCRDSPGGSTTGSTSTSNGCSNNCRLGSRYTPHGPHLNLLIVVVGYFPPPPSPHHLDDNHNCNNPSNHHHQDCHPCCDVLNKKIIKSFGMAHNNFQ